MVSQGLAELRLRNSSNLVMADTFTEVHRKDGLVCAVGDAAAVSVECAGVDGLEVWETLMDGEFATPVDGRVLSLGLARDASGRTEAAGRDRTRAQRSAAPSDWSSASPHLVRLAATAAWRHGL